MTELDEKNAAFRKRLLFKLTGVLLLAASFGLGWLIMDFKSFRQQPLNVAPQGETVEVSQGMTLRQLAASLHARGILEQPRYFIWLARYLRLDSRIKAGEYVVKGNVVPEGLLQLLTEGKVVQHSVTVVEGQTFREMLQRIRSTEQLEQTLEGLTDEQIMAALDHPGEHPEGRFLPETYYFPRGSSDKELLIRAYDAMAKFLDDVWPSRDDDLPLASPYEALILASIVEKESGRAEERPLIAGVFTRRLKIGMRLQTDPTIIYGLGEQFDGNIRRRDLQTDTPYNTYTRKGLPPTPIAMPGREAILSVLHPADGDALFFVSKGDGSHQFSADLEAHNRAVRKYQLKKK
jgi:UPF0755 protein